MADRAIGPHRSKNIPPLREANIVYLLIVCDQLRDDGALLDVPNGAGCVNAASPKAIWVVEVPIETSKWRAILHLLGLIYEGFLQLHLIGLIIDVPEPEELP